MTRTMIALAGALTLAAPGPASAQVTTGGAGNTGVTAPARTGGVGPGDVTTGNTANRSNSSVPGTTPHVSIGGTPTAGPPGTGGTAGGPALGNR